MRLFLSRDVELTIPHFPNYFVKNYNRLNYNGVSSRYLDSMILR